MCCPVKSFTKIFQLIVFLKGFREEERKKLAQIYGIFFANPLQPSATLGNPQCLNAVFEDHLVKEGRYPSTEDCSTNHRALSIECSGGVILTFCATATENFLFSWWIRHCKLDIIFHFCSDNPAVNKLKASPPGLFNFKSPYTWSTFVISMLKRTQYR